ncbi:hypothetical protein AZG88_15070 [Rhodococcus sp. LB1]|nr:hypothetical protein AZG88_15070 [Rhodococcus sp. LB1]
MHVGRIDQRRCGTTVHCAETRYHDEPVTPRRAVRRADQTVRGMLAMTVWVFDRVLDGVPGPGPPPT